MKKLYDYQYNVINFVYDRVLFCTACRQGRQCYIVKRF